MGRKKGDTSLVSKARRAKALEAFNNGMTVMEIKEKYNFYDYAHAYRSIKQAIGDDTDKEKKLYRDRQQYRLDRNYDLLDSIIYPTQCIPSNSASKEETNKESDDLGLEGNVATNVPDYVDMSVPIDADTIVKLMNTQLKIQERETKLRNLDESNGSPLSGDVVVHIVQDE